MGMACKICNSNNRLQIDRELCQGKGYTKIGKEYGESWQAVRNHWLEGHVSRQMLQAYQAKDVIEGQNLLQEIESLISRTKNLLSMAEDNAQSGKSSALNTAFKGIDSLRGHYELLSKIAFDLHAAKMKELELEQMNKQEMDQEEAEEYQAALGVLNEAELKVFNQLLEKITEQDEDVTVIDPGPAMFPEVKKSRSRRERREERQTEPAPEELEVQPEPKMKRTRSPKDRQAVKPIPSKTIRNLDDDNKAEIQRKKEKKAGPLL